MRLKHASIPESEIAIPDEPVWFGHNHARSRGSFATLSQACLRQCWQNTQSRSRS